MYAHELYEQSKPQVIVTYPGRFQPFHQGHAEVFSQLQKKFGRDSVYILTSNDTSSAKSPFSFSDKYQLMTAAGIPGDRIIETNQMYKLPANVDAANTIFITAVGAPDADRLNPDTFTKRDQKDKDGNVTKPAGSPSYYKIWNDKAQPVTADQHGYVIVIPEIHKEITIKGRKYDVSHGTECRNLWNTFRNDPKARKEFLSQMYKNPGQELAAIFNKIPQATAEDISTDSQTSTSPIHGGQPTQGVTEGSLNEFAPDNGGGDGRWYTDDEIADIIGEDWFEFDLSGEAANISRHGEHAKILLVQEAQAYFEDRGYHGVTVQDVRDDEDFLSWYISGNFTRLSEGATEGNNQSSVKTGIYQTDVLGAKAYHSKCLEKGCDWESRRYDRIKQAQDAAKKHAQTHIKPGMAEDAAGVGVVAKNKKMARDPRYSMSITKDVKPSTPKNMLRAFRLSENSDVSPETVMGMVKKFLPLAMKELKLSTLPKIVLKKHLVAHDGQATFGRFANEEQKIYLGIADRHPVDILRTLAHELVHYKQHAQGKLGPDSGETGSPIENQANAVAAVIMRHFNKKYPDAIHSNAISLEESLAKKYKTFLENDEPDEVRQKKNLIPFPKGTVKVDVSDVYDWYKIGQTISDLDDADPKDFGKGPPQTVLSFGSEPQEHKYLKDLKRLGLKTHDIDETYNGPKMKFLRPGELRGSYTDKQLRDMGFKRSEQGVWYIPYEQWKQLVASKTISENPDIVNEKKKHKKRKTNLKGRPFYGYYYGLGAAADSGTANGDGGESVAEGAAQDESAEDHGWMAELVDEINYNTFEVKLTNTRSRESANFVVRPVDMMRISGKLQIETMDVKDLQTGETGSWTTDMSDPKGAIVDAVGALFWDNPQLNKKLYAIVDAHSKKGQDMLPGQKNRAKVGMATPADQFIAGQDAIAKAKGTVKEFDAQGFQQRYTLYKDGYEIEKFGDMDDAIEYAEDDRRDGDDPSAVYKIVDINKQVVWDSNPYEKPSRIQLRKPDQGVAEGSQISNIIKILLKANDQDSTVDVKAMLDGEEVGHVNFDDSEGELIPQDLYVDPKYRGQGIAAAMYNYTKRKGYTILRGEEQSDDAIKLWNKHRPSQDVWEQGVTEAFDQPYKLKWEKSEHGDYDALATLDDGTYLSIMFNLGDQIEDHWMVEFYRNNSQEVTGEGDAQRVFATVLTAIQQFIKKKKPESLFFSAVKENDPTGSRTRLYDRLVQRYANGLGYNLQKEDYPEQTGYRLTKVKRGVAENFADGKNPGRKGLAKRMGVPTKASVSKLRKIAKSSSGEKQRMAHWLANMKAGKAKK